MPDTEFETDSFLQLLTDALRAGPGSPQWHEAVTQLRTSSEGKVDEYRLLLEARENLESGKSYREVRAGPGFTRRVMDGIDQEAAATSRTPTANLIAILAGAVIIGVILVIGFFLMRDTGGSSGTVADLQKRQFAAPTVFTFSQDIPGEWKKFGLAPMVSASEKALRGVLAKENRQDYTGGGIHVASPMAPGQAFQIDATVRVTRPTEQVVVQLFVTDDPVFDQNSKAATPHELVVYVQGSQIRVAKPDGSVVNAETKVEVGKAIHLVIKMDEKFAVVEADGRVLYADVNGLAPDRPRWPGIRFLTRGSEEAMERVTVQSIRIMKP